MILTLNITLLLFILFIIWWFWLYKPKAVVMVEQGEIEIHVKDGVYQPNLITTSVGKSLKIHFILEDETHCARTVIFPEFKISQELSKSHPEMIEILPKEPGEFEFACPMGMYRGKVIVSEAPILDILIEGGVYKPNLIRMKKGSTLNLRFIRRDPSKCAEMVIFSDLNIAKAIPLDEPQGITVKHDKTGEYSFTCDMGMYRGKLIIED